jgi:hypothetical protein
MPKSAKCLVGALLLILAVGPAAAQDEPDRCYTTTDPRGGEDVARNTFYNPSATMNWQQTRAQADGRVMQAMAGVYFAQMNDPTGQMVNRAYRSYEANGLWQYQDQTCTIGSPLPCSQNQGAGLWAGYQQPDGMIFLMVHFSDLSRSNNCFSQTVRADARGFTDTYGGSWQKVR